MIYLVGSVESAHRWCTDNGCPPVPDGRSIRFVHRLDQAQGVRPRPGDQIVVLGDLTDDQIRAFDRLKHQRELSRGRRENSLRQAP